MISFSVLLAKSINDTTSSTAGYRGSLRDVVYLGWPIAPSSPNAGGGGVFAGSHPMSTSVQITWHGAQINFEDLPPYLTYGRIFIFFWRFLKIWLVNFTIGVSWPTRPQSALLLLSCRPWLRPGAVPPQHRALTTPPNSSQILSKRWTCQSRKKGELANLVKKVNLPISSKRWTCQSRQKGEHFFSGPAYQGDLVPDQWYLYRLDEGVVGSRMGLFLIGGHWPKILPQNSKGAS